MRSFAFLRKNRMALGRQGESFAAEYFERNGFTILARNWRTNAGELDIVARRQKDIYFVEVKTLHHKEGYTPAGKHRRGSRPEPGCFGCPDGSHRLPGGGQPRRPYYQNLTGKARLTHQKGRILCTIPNP